MHIISIANQKGGCGKTTTAINLTSTLALNGARVLLVDLDPQSHATLGLNVECQYSIYNVISKITPRKVSVEDIVRRVEHSFDLLPSNILVGTLEQELANEIGRELKLAEALKPIRNRYDYIIIDCPPSLGFLTINALRFSDEVIIPVETSRFSLYGVERLMDIVQLIQERLQHTVAPKILITMFDSRLRHSFTLLDEVKKKYSGLLFDTIIHINVSLKKAVAAGSSVVVYDKYSRGFKDYFSLAKEVMHVVSAGDSQRVMQPAKTRAHIAIPQITFKCLAPKASSVYLTGTFNEWSLDEAYRMKQEEGGKWVLHVPLERGTYRYRFIVDGRWREDYENPQQERNKFGEINSIVEIK